MSSQQNLIHNTNNRIHLVSGINKLYLEKAIPFIESANANSNVNNIIITLDFIVTETVKKKFPNVSFNYLNSTEVEAPNQNACLQHGGFLTALKDITEKDIIIFTDADILVQRAFSSPELKMLSRLTEAEIGVGYNEAPNQTLMQEFQSLDPIVNSDEILELFPKAAKFAVYNTGVIIARKVSYQRLYTLYIKNWEKISSACKHYAKQQWLLSYLIQNHFNPLLLADEIHTHDHHPIDLRVDRGYGHKFCIENTPVIFSHHIPAYRNPAIIEKEEKRLLKKMQRLKRQILLWKLTVSISTSVSVALIGVLLYLLVK